MKFSRFNRHTTFRNESELLRLNKGIYKAFSKPLNREIYIAITEEYWNKATFAEGTTGEGWYDSVAYEGEHDGSYVYGFYPVQFVTLVEVWDDPRLKRSVLKQYGHYEKGPKPKKDLDATW